MPDCRAPKPHLGLALRLQLVKVGKDGVQLLRRRGLVLLVVAESNLKLLHLVRLALHVTLLRRLGDGVLLGQLVVGGLRRLLVSLGRLSIGTSKFEYCESGTGDYPNSYYSTCCNVPSLSRDLLEARQAFFFTHE